MIGVFKFKNAKLSTDFKTRNNLLTLEIDKDSTVAVKQILDNLQDENIYIAKISKNTSKRTLTQNSYLWILCQRIVS